MPATGSVNDGIHHMAGALGNPNLEGFVRQIKVLDFKVFDFRVVAADMGGDGGEIVVVPPALVASPVQSEIPDHERSGPNEHPSDGDDNTISETKEIKGEGAMNKTAKLPTVGNCAVGGWQIKCDHVAEALVNKIAPNCVPDVTVVRNKSSQDLILLTVLMELVLQVQNLVLPVLINTASRKELVLLMVKAAELEIRMHGDYLGMFIFELIDQGVGSTSGIRACALRNFDLGKMELENSQNNALAKLPMLKLGEYEMWEIRIKQYFQIQDYALWEVIENGNSWVPIPVTAPESGPSTALKMTVPSTTEEKICKKNDVKARSLLLMALPNEHQLTFNQGGAGW
ncbi:hypothetical protein Tco_0628606 [Tanacetum coccineum]|uniref:Uncharacterized protein n=1 Tax=Tanacetum coccineum TaxID=301880 RepID=A0ABQ4WQT4_9ASTR